MSYMEICTCNLKLGIQKRGWIAKNDVTAHIIGNMVKAELGCDWSPCPTIRLPSTRRKQKKRNAYRCSDTRFQQKHLPRENTSLQSTTHFQIGKERTFFIFVIIMFLPGNQSAQEQEEAARRAAFSRIEAWSLELTPPSLHSGLQVSVQEVQCNDPQCSPVDTAIAIVYDK